MKKLNGVQVHPAANILPMMTDEEFSDLMRDIESNGQSEPVIFMGEELLDGRNRYLACQELGVDPVYETIETDDPWGYVLSRNVHRRHLDASQRALVAANLTVEQKKSRLLRGQTGCPGTPKGDIAEKAAERLGVSERSVKRAETVVRGGSAGLNRKVAAGVIPVKTAAELVAVEPNKRKQDEIHAQGNRAIKTHIAEAKSEPAGNGKPQAETPPDPNRLAKLNRQAAKDLINRAVRAVDDYHNVKANRKTRDAVVKLLQQAGENLW